MSDVSAEETTNKKNDQQQSYTSVVQPSDHQEHDLLLLLRPPLLQPTPPDHDELVRPMICRLFIASHTLRMDTETRFTAVVLWHRYCSARTTSVSATAAAAAAAASNNDNDDDTGRFAGVFHDDKDDDVWTAAACLFLASKVEEEPLRLRDIINVAHMILKGRSSTIVDTKNGPQPPAETMIRVDRTSAKSDNTNTNVLPISISVCQNPPPLDEHYWKTKEQIVRAEQIVLRWIGFDTFVSKPHRAVPILLESKPELLCQTWGLLLLVVVPCDQLVPMAWKRLNDGLFYSTALQHSVVELACAAIGLAVEEIWLLNRSNDNKDSSNINANNSERTCDSVPWWRAWNVTDISYKETKTALSKATELLKNMGGNSNGFTHTTETLSSS